MTTEQAFSLLTQCVEAYRGTAEEHRQLSNALQAIAAVIESTDNKAKS